MEIKQDPNNELINYLSTEGASEKEIQSGVISLIDKCGASIYTRNSRSYTLLMLSLKQNYLDIAKEFIQR